jgi:hypothetical protein
VICFDRVVRVLLEGMQGRGDQLVEDQRVDVRPVGRDLHRDRAGLHRSDKEASCGRQVTPHGQQDVDDLAMLVDSPVQVSPLTGHLHVRLIDEPPVTRSMPTRASGLCELRGKALHPPVDTDVIDGDAALGQQLFHIPVGQSVAQVPADRDRDHLTREPEANEH